MQTSTDAFPQGAVAAVPDPGPPPQAQTHNPPHRRRRLGKAKLKALGARMQSWREARGLSQSEAADMMDVHQTRWSRWERGRCVPDTLDALLWLELNVGIPMEAWSPSYAARDALVKLMTRRWVALPAAERVRLIQLHGSKD